MKPISRALTVFACLLLTALTTVPLYGRQRQKKDDYKAGDGFKEYTVQNVGIGKTGTYVVSITTRSARPDVELVITAKNAVHAVLFKGIPSGGGYSAQAPIAGTASAEEASAAFFENFFLSDYKQFISDIVRSSIKIERQADKSYHTTAVIAILKDDLRHYLEDNEIISRLAEH